MRPPGSARGEDLLARFPTRDDARYYHAAARFLRDRAAEAIDEARRLLTSNPQHAKAQNLLGRRVRRPVNSSARIAFEASIDLAPRDPSPYRTLVSSTWSGGNPTVAVDYFAEALALDQTSTMAREGLAQARRRARDQMKRPARAPAIQIFLDDLPVPSLN